jgi:hypothetical protein
MNLRLDSPPFNLLYANIKERANSSVSKPLLRMIKSTPTEVTSTGGMKQPLDPPPFVDRVSALMSRQAEPSPPLEPHEHE